jgi:hypothetical protein
METYTKIDFLLGKTLTEIKVSDDKDEILFYTTDDEVYKMYHDQDCCEDVYIEDITGNLTNLIGKQLVMAEVATNSGDINGYDTYTWTFYKFATIKGYVTIRWYGTSNGYYSEEVSFERIS